MDPFTIIFIILLIIILIFFFSLAVPILIIAAIFYAMYWIIKSGNNNNNNNNNMTSSEAYHETSPYFENYSTWYEPVQEYFDATINDYPEYYPEYYPNIINPKISEYCVDKKLSQGYNYQDAVNTCQF